MKSTFKYDKAAAKKALTDLGVLEPDPETCELTMTQLHEGVEIDQAREATGWELKVADELATTEPPSDEELAALRDLLETQKAAA